ncbi:MAG: hypothetical protein LN364_03210, partial [Candidatus Thermoplasmatota archaeon]|nr:hypothetical protein [Candidatus Thermoplasmatota archaeon]
MFFFLIRNPIAITMKIGAVMLMTSRSMLENFIYFHLPLVQKTTPRTINISEQLTLGIVFNGLVSTSGPTHGDGTYLCVGLHSAALMVIY